MKNVVIVILLIATVVLGSLYLKQSHQSTQAQAHVTGLEQRVSELQTSLAEQEKRADRWRDQSREAIADADAKALETAQVRASLAQNLTNQTLRAMTNAVALTNSKASNPLSEMFKNPEMKEMIRDQQKTAISAMIDKNYGKLFSDLHLTPEQSSALKEMLLNKQLAAAQMGMTMISEDLDPAKRAELAKQNKAANDEADARIKEWLGDGNFAQFQDYEKTLGERTAVSGFKEKLAGGTLALSDAQEQQLILAMTSEHQNFKFTTDYSDKSKFNGDFAAMFTEDKMNRYFQEQSQLNQGYLTRAQSILSADQLAAFEKQLASQQALQKAGMQMAAKMFAPAKPADN